MKRLCLMICLCCFVVNAMAETVSPGLAKVLANVGLKMRARNWDAAVKTMMDYGGERVPIWHNTIGQVYLAKGDSGLAIKHLKRALDKHRKPSYGLDLAQAYVTAKQFEKAKDLFATYATTQDSAASHWERYVQVVQKTEDERLLGELLAAGLVRFPGSRYLRQVDVRYHIRHRNHARALQALNYMIRLEPGQYQWWVSRHSVREQASDVDGAASLADLEMAARLAPDNVGIKYRLVHLYHREGLIEQAWSLAQRIMADTQFAPVNVVVGCAQLALEKGRPVIATTWLKAVPADKRTAAYHGVALELALQAGDKTTPDVLNAHLNALSALATPPIHYWILAGQWATSHKQDNVAEGWYLTAQQLDTDHRYKASLHLAQYRMGQGKLSAAKALIESYLQAQPQDQAARAMLLLVE